MEEVGTIGSHTGLPATTRNSVKVISSTTSLLATPNTIVIVP